MTVLKYLQAYPQTLQEQVRQLIERDQLGNYLNENTAKQLSEAALVKPL